MRSSSADRPERLRIVPGECKPLTPEQERLILAEAVHARHEGFSSLRIRFEGRRIKTIPEKEGHTKAA